MILGNHRRGVCGPWEHAMQVDDQRKFRRVVPPLHRSGDESCSVARLTQHRTSLTPRNWSLRTNSAPSTLLRRPVHKHPNICTSYPRSGHRRPLPCPDMDLHFRLYTAVVKVNVQQAPGAQMIQLLQNNVGIT